MPHRRAPKFGVDHPKSTWAVLPCERERMPSLCIVTNPAGRVIAVIDPLTRQRKTPSGNITATLTAQGWDLSGKSMRRISLERKTPWGLYPEAPRER